MQALALRLSSRSRTAEAMLHGFSLGEWYVRSFIRFETTLLSSLLTHLQFLFFLRIPFLIFFGFTWFAFIQWTTPGTLLRKANLWCIIGIPGIWWVDLQVDGVRRG
jgi:hypothetical protein